MTTGSDEAKRIEARGHSPRVQTSGSGRRFA